MDSKDTVKLKKKYRESLIRLICGESGHRPILEYLGCSRDEYIDYLNKRFQKGMTLDNFKEVWTIGHLVPCQAFEFKDKVDLVDYYFYENTYPFYIEDMKWVRGNIHLLNNISKKNFKSTESFMLKEKMKLIIKSTYKYLK